MNLTKEIFKSHLQKTGLIKKDDMILVAFSGGKDSTTLLHLLLSLKKEMMFSCKALYFNHQIRSDYKKEELWVKEFSKKHQIELFCNSFNVKQYANNKKLNLEETASFLRYKFFNSIIADHPSAKITTAHTKSDQTETFFIKLFRGSGIEGLTGISEIKNKIILRPLLSFCQEDILDYLTSNNLKYYFDPSNKNKSFLRNNIRLEVIPAIKSISPNIEHHIKQTTSLLFDELSFFKTLANDFLKKNITAGKILVLKPFSGLHIALKRHILREYIRKIKGNLLNLNFNHLQSLISNINGSRNISLPGIDLCISKGFLFPKLLNFEEIDYSFTIDNGPYVINLETLQKQITIQITSQYTKPPNNNWIIIPLKSLKFPLVFRSPKKNDKYTRINSNINLSVFEMIREQGAPSEFRNLYPVLSNADGEIIWCFSSPVSEKFKVKPGYTGKFLFIQINHFK